MSSISCDIIDDMTRLAALAPQWWSLWRKIPVSTVFQTPAWIRPWWDIFHPGELRCITAHSGGTLIGLAPLWLERGQLGVRLLPLGIGISDYCDILVDPDYGAEACDALSVMLAALSEWDSCEFSELPSDACALQLASPKGSVRDLRDASVAPVLPIPAGADSLAGVVPSVQHRNFRRGCAAAEKHGPTRLTPVTMATAQDYLAELVRLHTECWISRGEPGVFADERVVRFHSLALEELIASGAARMLRLSISDNVAAIYYGFFDHGRAYAYLQGYAPEFSAQSPGTVVVGHAIQAAIRDSAREFHFLRGNETYKFAWGAVARTNRLQVFSRVPVFA